MSEEGFSGPFTLAGVINNLDAQRKDAARWRWLRDSEGALEELTACWWRSQSAEEFDAAIDAAMSAEREKGKT